MLHTLAAPVLDPILTSAPPVTVYESLGRAQMEETMAAETNGNPPQFVPRCLHCQYLHEHGSGYHH